MRNTRSGLGETALRPDLVFFGLVFSHVVKLKSGSQKRGHIEKHHGDNDQGTDDPPDDLYPLILLFVSEK